MNRASFVLFSLLLLLNFQSALGQKKRTLTVMTYNVENLFDTKHDVFKLSNGKIIRKQDFAYLPLSTKQSEPIKSIIADVCSKEKMPNFYYRRECLNKDWSLEVYKIKLANISKAIRYNSVNKCGADIIYLEEVENIKALAHLKATMPRHCGYKYFGLLEGPDKRGIDIGFISRFKPVGHKLIDYPLQAGDRKRRSLYQVTFNVYGKSVTIVGNHWPSLATKEMKSRMIPAQLLANAAVNSKADLFVAVGDFNTNEQKEMPIFTHLNQYFVDALGMGLSPNKPGSHYYRGHWGFLDRIFVSRKTAKTTSAFKPLWKSFYVVNKGLLWDRDIKGRNGKVKYKKGTPHRFSEYFKQGYSDHLPLIMTFELR